MMTTVYNTLTTVLYIYDDNSVKIH